MDFRAGRKPWAFTELILWKSENAIDVDASPRILSGTGVPTAVKPFGTFYFRSDGTTLDTAWYVASDSVGGWKAIDLASEMGPITVKNASGGDYVKGTLVYVSGWDSVGGMPEVTAASNADLDTRAIYVLIEAIANGASGIADGAALVGTLNTNAFNVDDKVYLLTAGTWGVAPAAPAIKQEVGVVAVKSATVGQVKFYPGLTAIQGIEITDVNMATGSIAVGVAGVSAELALGGTAQGIPYGNGAGVVAVGNIAAHGASTSTSVAPGTSDTNTTGVTAAGAATSSVVTGVTAAGAATSSDVTGVTAAGAATSSVVTGVTAAGAATSSDVTGVTAAGANTAAGGTGATGAPSADDTAAATAGSTAETRVGSVHYVNPIAEEYISIVADVLAANGAQIIAGQPDCPRTICCNITIAVNPITAGDLTFVGVGQNGQPVTRVMSLITAVTTVKYAPDVFATVTSATITGLTGGGGAGDNIGVGVAEALGLPACNTPVPSAWSVYKTVVDYANEAVAGVDAANGSVEPTTAPNGVHDYDFYYTYSVTPTQSAHQHGPGLHTHTGPSHDHAAGAITVTDAGHDHAAGAITITDAGHDHAAGAITVTDAGHDHAAGAITITDAGHDHAAGAITVTDGGHDHAHATTHAHDVTPPAHSIA